MKIRAAGALGFPVEIPVLNVKAHCQAHVGASGQLLAGRALVRRAAELKDRRVFSLDHFGAQFDFHRAAVAGAGDKIPDGRRPDFKRGEAFEIQRREEAVSVHPDAEAFDENVAVHRKVRIQIGTENAVVFGIDAAQIHADARHAAEAVGEQNQAVGMRNAECGMRNGWKKADCSGDICRSRCVSFQRQLKIGGFIRREAGDVDISRRNGLDMNCVRIFVPHSAFRTRHLQRGAERRGVLNQQPVARRNERNAAAVNQRPFNHARKDFSRFHFGQQIGERSFGVARGKFGGGGKEIFWRAAGLFCQPAPIEAVNGFGGNDFVQRLQRPGGLRAGAAVIVAAQAGGLFGRCQAKGRAGREGKSGFAFGGGNFWRRLAEQFNCGLRIADCGLRKRDWIFFFDVGVDENEDGIFALGGFAEQGVDRRIGRAQPREFRAVKKTRMVGDEPVELREFGNDVVGAVPVQSGAAVDKDFFGRQPFDAAGEAEAAAWTRQRAEPVPQQRPRAAFFGEAVVVVRFGIVNIAAGAFALTVGVIEIPRDITTGIILEQLGVGPLHSAFG